MGMPISAPHNTEGEYILPVENPSVKVFVQDKYEILKSKNEAVVFVSFDDELKKSAN
jgi:hypothetical protein